MTTRRRFLGAIGAAAAAPMKAGLRAQTKAAGRTGIVDWHAHWIGPHVIELLEKRPSPRPPAGDAWTNVDARLREMDRAGVERQVLSYVGASYDGVMPPEEARAFWRAQNDDVAAVVRKYPARFSGCATLPTARIEWAAAELERAHSELGLIGATLPLDAFVSLSGAKAFAPVFAVAQKHHSHIIVHRGAASPDVPGQHAEAGASDAYFGLSRPKRGAPPAADGDYPAGRAGLVTASHLATGMITLGLTNFLDSYPDVTVQMAMIGGAFAWVAEQIQMAAEESGQPVPDQRFKRLYVDTGNTGRGPRSVTLAAQVFGADRILFGTDSGPVPMIVPTVESVGRATLTKAELDLIFTGNARRLLTAKRASQ
ncbi:MAG TPA: amidohydrolase family protein [Vicinamibacterales bacterium]|nr:amidohydrolase family protein [Vicinamibacterales bacterium]